MEGELIMFCPNCGFQNNDNSQYCIKCGTKIYTTPGMGSNTNMGQNTQFGLQKNVAALLCYVFGWISGLVFYFVEKDRFIRFHAIQSIITFGAFSVIEMMFSIVMNPFFFFRTFFIMVFINIVLGIAAFVLWILLMVKAYQGEWFKLPIAGDLAEKYCN